MISSEKKPNKNLINTLFNSNPKYKDPKACAAAKTSTFTGFYNAGYYAGAFFAAPILGALSDAIGRRPVMIIAIVSESYVFSKLFVINIGVFFEIKNFPQKKKKHKKQIGQLLDTIGNIFVFHIDAWDWVYLLIGTHTIAGFTAGK